jgi:arylsulfatase A-like enzyme/Tfp pilus assembly protein PilF
VAILTFLRMQRRMPVALLFSTLVAACARQPEPPPAARNLLLITIDTLRADRVGVSGYAAARTPNADALATRGTRFTHAYAAAPITLPSHASLMSGRYPPGHGARHNGMRVDGTAPLLAETLARSGFATGAFVAAFPLDRRFGLERGFQTYSDHMPRINGKTANERQGAQVVDEALAWLGQNRQRRFFLWVHLFEPHAPYGLPTDRRPASDRYDDEVAEADRQAGRVIDALGADRDRTLVVLTADHGEAFGEHEEFTHSLFVYDTTLHVPLIVAGPGIGVHTVATPVSLVDVAPTVARRLGIGAFDADGVDLSASFAGAPLTTRALYAESFAPLLDFGWSPLRSLRDGDWKVIDAPRPELYQLSKDPAESQDLAAADTARTASMRERVQRYSPVALTAKPAADPEAAARLQALGYVGKTRGAIDRADPKDRRKLAADLARVASGELRGPALATALREILSTDPDNPQANVRFGFMLQEAGNCAQGTRYFAAAIAGGMPGADPYLGLAACQVQAKRLDAAAATLRNAERAEPGNPVAAANLGIVLSDSGHPADALPAFERALRIDPDFHEARFNLAIAYGRLGRPTDAAREAVELLKRMPEDAPQRAEVQRLLDAVRK